MRLLLTLFMALLTGCVAMQESKPPPQHTIQKFSISEELPTLPSGSRLIPGTHFSVIFANSAATLLVPVPFVGEAGTKMWFVLVFVF